MQKITEQLKLKGRFKATLRDLEGNVILEKEVDNLVVDVAKYGFAGLVAGEAGFTGEINYLAVGTGTNSPAAGDTTLQTELARTTIVGGTLIRTLAEVYMEFYFAPTEAIGNIKEVGAFIDGTASANSGTLFDRALLDITKLATNSLTISLTVNVS